MNEQPADNTENEELPLQEEETSMELTSEEAQSSTESSVEEESKLVEEGVEKKPSKETTVDAVDLPESTETVPTDEDSTESIAKKENETTSTETAEAESAISAESDQEQKEETETEGVIEVEVEVEADTESTTQDTGAAKEKEKEKEKDKPAKKKKKRRSKKSNVKVEDILLPIEAMCFVSENSVRINDIRVAVENAMGLEASTEVIHEALDIITEKYADDRYPFELTAISDGYRFLTKQSYHKIISSYLNVKSKRRLSTSAMETLSIIAYKQPITKSNIEDIRGVSCDYSIQKLLEKELIQILGRSDALGRPLLYGTSKFFMDYFGLKSMDDLPKLKEVVPQDNQIGEADQDIIELVDQGQQEELQKEEETVETTAEPEITDSEQQHTTETSRETGEVGTAREEDSEAEMAEVEEIEVKGEIEKAEGAASSPESPTEETPEGTTKEGAEPDGGADEGSDGETSSTEEPED